MKKIFILFITLAVIVCFVGCDSDDSSPTVELNDPSSTEEANVVQQDTSSADEPEATAPTEETQKDYQANLPANVVITFGENVSEDVFNKRAHDVFAELKIENYKDHTTHNPEDFPNGIPYDVWYSGENGTGVQQIYISELRLIDQNDVIVTNHVSVEMFDGSKQSLLGIAYDSTLDDICNILGNYDYDEIDKGRDWVYEYSWDDVKIGEYAFYISVDIVDEHVNRIFVQREDLW